MALRKPDRTHCTTVEPQKSGDRRTLCCPETSIDGFRGYGIGILLVGNGQFTNYTYSRNFVTHDGLKFMMLLNLFDIAHDVFIDELPYKSNFEIK